MTSKQPYTGNQSEVALKAELVKISNANPGKAVLVAGQFGKLTIYIYKSLSAIPVDSAQARSMIWSFGGVAFVNGKLSQPTKGWSRKQVLADKATYQG
jgi:hypothetical protein